MAPGITSLEQILGFPARSFYPWQNPGVDLGRKPQGRRCPGWVRQGQGSPGRRGPASWGEELRSPSGRLNPRGHSQHPRREGEEGPGALSSQTGCRGASPSKEPSVTCTTSPSPARAKKRMRRLRHVLRSGKVNSQVGSCPGLTPRPPQWTSLLYKQS